MAYPIPSCGDCQYDARFRCGVVKVLGNCPYADLSLCKEDQNNAQVVMGCVSDPGKPFEISLRIIRFRRATASTITYDNVCPQCGIFWGPDFTTNGCVVCKQGG